ncbi:hypothetical protein MRB53_039889 [Persea americana]|nr:hypothetical protein MRB53_039889 [Persea americana]
MPKSNMPIPKYPILFYKPVTSVAGPFDSIPVPPMAQECLGLDHECELVAVIGKAGSDIPESKALEHVAGYAVGNDVSHREWQIQRGGSQWSLGKGFDGWAPFGPGIVSSSIIKDPQNLQISTKVNGKVMQNSNTKDLIFGVAKTIAFLSQGTTLLPVPKVSAWDASRQSGSKTATRWRWLSRASEAASTRWSSPNHKVVLQSYEPPRTLRTYCRGQDVAQKHKAAPMHEDAVLSETGNSAKTSFSFEHILAPSRSISNVHDDIVSIKKQQEDASCAS